MSFAAKGQHRGSRLLDGYGVMGRSETDCRAERYRAKRVGEKQRQIRACCCDNDVQSAERDQLMEKWTGTGKKASGTPFADAKELRGRGHREETEGESSGLGDLHHVARRPWREYGGTHYAS